MEQKHDKQKKVLQTKKISQSEKDIESKICSATWMLQKSMKSRTFDKYSGILVSSS